MAKSSDTTQTATPLADFSIPELLAAASQTDEPAVYANHDEAVQDAMEVAENVETNVSSAIQEELVTAAAAYKQEPNPETVSVKFLDTPRVAQEVDPTKGLDVLGRKRVIGLRTAGAGVNPKDRIGASKVDLTLIPGTAKVAMALALMEGATKYGPYNWRVEPVQMRTYIGAAMRHLEDCLDGGETDLDSSIELLGHVMACCGIIIDAKAQGTIIDDRPIPGRTSDAIRLANQFIAQDKPEGWGR